MSAPSSSPCFLTSGSWSPWHSLPDERLSRRPSGCRIPAAAADLIDHRRDEGGEPHSEMSGSTACAGSRLRFRDVRPTVSALPEQVLELHVRVEGEDA